jgi:selenocysteine lyase/cysteine desulfurase
MIYLDNAATTLRKPPQVSAAVLEALRSCANPGRGGHAAAARAEETVYRTRKLASEFFGLEPEQICFTANATEGLNIALRTLVRPGDRVVLSGLEHNAVTRTLTGLGAKLVPVTAPIFDADRWAEAFAAALSAGASCCVCLHASNVFGALLPVDQIGALCAERRIPFVVDASQSAGLLPVTPERWQAAFTAMPGHKGLLGPQGTGILLCREQPLPLRFGGTGSLSMDQKMPRELPDCLEAGTLNVPGIAGLGAALGWLRLQNRAELLKREKKLLHAVLRLRALGAELWTGPDQIGVLSFRLPNRDPEETAARYARAGVALRAGLHCAPLAHRTGGTLPEGTVRLSLSVLTEPKEIERFLSVTKSLLK